MEKCCSSGQCLIAVECRCAGDQRLSRVRSKSFSELGLECISRAHRHTRMCTHAQSEHNMTSRGQKDQGSVFVPMNVERLIPDQQASRKLNHINECV